MTLSANEISRMALGHLGKKWPEPVKFQDMLRELDLDARNLSKNLFWLEEHRLVKLSTSLPPSSTFPHIVLVRLTPEGEEVAADPKRMERRFPSPKSPSTERGPVTYRRMLEKLRDHLETKEGLDPDRRHDLLRCLDEILALDELDIPYSG